MCSPTSRIGIAMCSTWRASDLSFRTAPRLDHAWPFAPVGVIVLSHCVGTALAMVICRSLKQLEVLFWDTYEGPCDAGISQSSCGGSSIRWIVTILMVPDSVPLSFGNSQSGAAPN